MSNYILKGRDNMGKIIPINNDRNTQIKGIIIVMDNLPNSFNYIPEEKKLQIEYAAQQWVREVLMDYINKHKNVSVIECITNTYLIFDELWLIEKQDNRNYITKEQSDDRHYLISSAHDFISDVYGSDYAIRLYSMEKGFFE